MKVIHEPFSVSPDAHETAGDRIALSGCLVGGYCNNAGAPVGSIGLHIGRSNERIQEMDDTDISSLIRELKEKSQSDVRIDQLSREIYSTDASDYRKIPAAVVIPKSAGDVSAALSIAGGYSAGLIPRGGGSSLSGQTVGEGMVMDHSRHLNRILEFNAEEKWVWAEAGVVLDRLNAFLAAYHLMVGPDPSSGAVATLGGMVGNNSTGAHSVKYGMMADHLLALEVMLADGSRAVLEDKSPDEVAALAMQDTAEGRLYREIPRILEHYRQEIETRYPGTWRNVAGYGLNRLLADFRRDGKLNLAKLLAGSEGTLAFITRVKLSLVPRPAITRLMILHFDDLPEALEQVPSILQHPVAAVELMTYPLLKLAHDHPFFGDRMRRFVRGLPGAILIVEFADQTGDAVEAQAGTLEANLAAEGYGHPVSHCTTPEEISRVWDIRKAVLGLLLSRPTGTRRTSIIDDPTVPVEEMKDFTADVIEAGKRYGLSINFDAHASAGCLHMTPELDLKTLEGVRILERLSGEIVDIAVSHHGTSTGEHGDGLARSYFIERVYGSVLNEAFREVKAAFDPGNLLNPGKIINPRKPWDTAWFRYSPGYSRPCAPAGTIFDYAPYDGYAGLVEMCNGTGTCRSQVSGTMCPSYRVTGEELHSTRGRANILRAAIAGEFGPSGFTDPKLYEALDLCVECKACRNECPTRVDMAKLKYEFLAHYQARHGVPLRSRLFAGLEWIGRLGRLAPGVTNRVFANQAFRSLLDRMVGVDRRRELPALSGTTFQRWFRSRRSPRHSGAKKIVLWDDCHISQHQPGLGRAAVRLLEAAGFDVHLVSGRRCCGRPMLSKGMLSRARANARHNVALLAPWAEKGVPVVGVEPGCISSFQDEYPDLLGTAESRTVAANSFFMETFVTGLAREEKLQLEFDASAVPEKILVHTHCYQKAFGTAADVLGMLRLMPGVHVEEIQSGCCGMAGSFGYEKEHYEISMAMGEAALFPAVRAASAATVIAAAGTSCREQIKDGTPRQARHPVEIVAGALVDRSIARKITTAS